ncbi:MAG: TlpA family protein disulfide reductase [Leptolinea sp.]|nr:TlpA family protein disulfide reductase [Leptolinea sp.]
MNTVNLDHKMNDKKRTSNWMVAIGVLFLLGFLAVLAQGLRLSGRGPLKKGDPLPAFELSTFDGQTLRTTNLPGKVVVINFWSSWCQPCEQEAAEFELAWKAYKAEDEVVFLGVAYMDIESEAKQFISRYGITYPNGSDLGASISKLFKVRGVPETFIFNRDGTLVHYQYGPFLSKGEIMSIVDPLTE